MILSWWLLALGLAVIVAAGVGLWRSKPVKLIRAVRLERRATSLLLAGYVGQAEDLIRRSLRLAEEAQGPEGADVGPILANLAQIYKWQEKCDDAERLYRRAIAIREKAVGPADPVLPVLLTGLAGVLESLGRTNEVSTLDARAKAIEEASADQKGVTVEGEGFFTREGLMWAPPGWRERMRSAEAATEEEEIEGHLVAALLLAEQKRPEGPHVGETLHALGRFYYRRGDLEEAERHFKQAVSVREGAFGADDGLVGPSLYNLAEVYVAQQRYSAALSLV